MRWLKILLTFSFLFSLTSCFEKLPMTTVHSVTEWGAQINELYLLTTVIVTFVFFAVAIPFCYAIWKFREKEGDTRIPEQIHGNHKLEVLWTLIPIVLLIFIFIPTVQLILSRFEEPPKDTLKIQAIAHQWWWEFKYPDLGITTANEMYVPEGKHVTIELTSADVIHSFWIPRWGGKVDNLPGETNYITYTTPAVEDAENGDYYQGHCVELCGLSHARMRYQAVVLPQERFDAWTKVAQTPPTVTTALEKKGQELFMSKTCFTCHAIEGTTAQGRVGPDLTNFGSRRMLAAGTLPNDKEGMYEWLRDSVDSKPPYQNVKPGSLMIFGEGFELTDEDIEALTAYLQNSTAKTY
ncbi:cytochrome c oxidase subunit II [Pseudobacteriovorax antillogorgiicola]|nr:cytochrome c oxidase subunit II [Pseudobacteriovorax antillogorgiicola]